MVGPEEALRGAGDRPRDERLRRVRTGLMDETVFPKLRYDRWSDEKARQDG